jgi:hypothetical protein
MSGLMLSSDCDTFFNTWQDLFFKAQLIDEQPILAATIPEIWIPPYYILQFSPFSSLTVHLQTEYCVLYCKVIQKSEVLK